MSSVMEWTNEQQRAIDFPAEGSACVTAAAGSGKTALLIERVVNLIKKGEVPADKLAILTFTRNAAEEFRTRMTAAIDKATRSNTVQREQLIKFRSSVITTINSFCLGILKEHTELFDLPVNFSILEESKGDIMLEKALDKTMEYFYSGDFVEDFPESYKTFMEDGDKSDSSKEERDTLGKMAREQLYKSFSFSKDDALRKAIMAIYKKTTSLTNSDEWLVNSAKAYSSVSRMEEAFMPQIIEGLRNEIMKFQMDIEQEETLCLSIKNAQISSVFMPVFNNDKKLVSDMANSFNSLYPEQDSGTSADESGQQQTEKSDEKDGAEPSKESKALTPLDKAKKFFEFLSTLSFVAFSRNPNAITQLPDYKKCKAEIDVIRERMKDRMSELKLQRGYFTEEAEKQLPAQHMAVSALVMLVQRLANNYNEMKAAAGVVDFADCENKLLNKLKEKDCPLRQELSERYSCIIVDEFQDTNDLEYEIFRLISREEKNLFFVGDVKQSIYAFRGGNPRIMAGCCENSEVYEKLPLNKNFRSREEVISTVNSMFNDVMTKRYGDVDYADGNRLALGASFPAQQQGDKTYYSELYMLDFKGVEEGNSSESGKTGSTDKSNSDPSTGSADKPGADGEVSQTDDAKPSADNTDATKSEAAAKEAEKSLAPADKSQTSGKGDKYKLPDNNAICEARFTASTINRMVKEKFMVKKDKESLRPCTWGDFAILLRSKTHMPEYKAELEKLGIPVASNSGSYLSTDEINLILNYLKVIDNPHLDEELLAVLMSPLYCFDAEELAMARLGILGYDLSELTASEINLEPIFERYSNRSLFGCINAAAQEEPEEKQSEKDENDGSPVDENEETHLDGEAQLAAEEQARLNEDAPEEGSDEKTADTGEKKEEERLTAEQALEQLKKAGVKRSANEKCRRFMEHFKEFQRYAANNSIERLIRRIYDDTDFFSVISTYERGDKKLANIRLLLKYTADFESGGGGTLNDFLRYTDAVRENSDKMEEAQVPQEAEDAVQLLTFHASKGLQWKIVVLAGLGTLLHNEKRSNIIIDRETGIGLKHTDLKTRIRNATVGYNGALASAKTAQLGDELRLLYVAMTRAEEKLIMIGQMNQKAAKECCAETYSPEFVLSGSSFMDWIVSSLLRYRPDLKSNDISDKLELQTPKLTLQRVIGRLPDPDELADEQTEQVQSEEPQAATEYSKEQEENIEEAAKEISDMVKTRYSHQYETTLQSRFSVTEIAHKDDDKKINKWETILPKPSFMAVNAHSGMAFSGALIGNTYHHIMELIPLEQLHADYSVEDMEAAVENEIDILISEQLLTPEECVVAASRDISDALGKSMHDTLVERIAAFFCGDLGQDMLTAQRIEREYEVFAELPARTALNDDSAPEDSTTIIQGRVDMLFIKDGRMVVVDYKSDSDSSLFKELDSYMEQLQLYKTILPKLITGFDKDNIGLYIYSFGQYKAYDVEKLSEEKAKEQALS